MEDTRGQARLGFSARGRRGRPGLPRFKDNSLQNAPGHWMSQARHQRGKGSTGPPQRRDKPSPAAEPAAPSAPPRSPIQTALRGKTGRPLLPWAENPGLA